MEHNRILVVFHWHWQCAANTHMRMQRFEFLQSYIHTDFSSFSLSTSDQRVHFCSAFPSERSLLRLQRRIKGTITLNYWSDFTLVRAPIVQGVTYQFFSFVLFCVRVQQIILNFFRSAISKLRSSRKSNKYQNKNIINKTNKNYDWIIPRQVNSRVWLYFFFWLALTTTYDWWILIISLGAYRIIIEVEFFARQVATTHLCTNSEFCCARKNTLHINIR